MILPEKYLNYIREILDDEFDAYIESFHDKRLFGLRVNTLKISKNQLRDLLETELEPVSWCSDGFYYSENFRPAKSPYYHGGLYYIQEPSAMSAASIVPIEKGDRVLDICSAPGGKSTQVGAKLQGTGIIVSNDISATRCRALLKNIEVFGITNTCITNENPEKLASKFESYFDKILIDAPCSGEGMFRKDENAVKSWEEYKGEKCALTQREILYYADKMLAPGGIIAYSTCTFNMVENELQIKDFLDKNKNYSLVSIDHELYGISQGFEVITEKGENLRNCGRLWPHRQKGEGHFIALLKKEGERSAENNQSQKPAKIEGIEYFKDFAAEYLNIEIPDNIICHGKSLMSVYKELPDLKGIRIIRSGWYLGDIKTKRFEPSQAFAMGLKKEDVKYTIDFKIDDENLFRYLKGESFEVAGENVHDGWNLVCVGGYPLGWGKVKDGRMKNKYLKSWLMN